MIGKHLLDTNIVVAFFAADEAVRIKMAELSETYVPVVVVAELYFGAICSRQKDANVRRIDEFISSSSIVSCDLSTAREYGIVKSELRAAGTPIPENDIWIAAIARQHKMVLVSRDRHFGAVPTLTQECW